MPIDVESWNTFAAFSLNRLWIAACQWTLLVIVVALPAHWLLRGRAPALRYWLWQILLLKLLIMPLWTYTLPAGSFPEVWAPIVPPATLTPHLAQPHSSPAELASNASPAGLGKTLPEISGHSPPASEARPGPALSWQAWLQICWAGVVLLQIGRLIVQHRRLDRVLRAA